MSREPRVMAGDANPLDLSVEPEESIADILDQDRYGFPRPSLSNIERALSLDPSLIGRWRRNTFASSTEIKVGEKWEAVTDETEARLAVWLDRVYEVRAGAGDLTRAVDLVANNNKVHPVQDYLRSCPWDGTPRVHAFAARHLQAPDTEVHSQMGRCFLLSCVARAMSPGSKVDTVLILLGDQGFKKSQVLASLVPDPSWFSDTPTDLRSKDAFGNMAGVWIYEFAELDSVARQDTNYVKAFLASQKDKYRPPYGKRDIVVPRGLVFVASTNDREFLRDPTGNRRFWPFEITGELNTSAVALERDQIWGEAFRMFNQENAEERRWWFERDEQAEIDQLCANYTAQHHWFPKVDSWVRGRRLAFTTSDVLDFALSIPIDRQTTAQARDVAAILRQLGVVAAPRTRKDGAYVRQWKPL